MTIADKLAKKGVRKTGGAEWGILLAIAGAILFGIAWSVAMIWWLAWSILDLANGNPATWWNILGIVIPSVSVLSSVFKGVSK